MLAARIAQLRPGRADAARNYDALMEAARDAFGASGVDVPLEEIARCAGVGVATLYRNFSRPTVDDESLTELVQLRARLSSTNVRQQLTSG